MEEQALPESEAGRPKPGLFPSRPIDPLGAWRRYGRFGLGVFLAIAALGLVFAYVKGKAVYYTEAAVYVSRSFVKNLESDDELDFNSNSDYRQFVQHQTRELTSYDVAVQALRDLGPDASLWTLPEESPRRAAERLQASLQVRAVPDTYLITVGLEGDEANGLSRIVNAVVESYLARQKAVEIENPVARRDQLSQHFDSITARMRQSTEQLAAMAQELGVTSFEEKFLNPYDNLLKNGSESLAIARRRRIEAEAAAEAGKRHLARLENANLDGPAERLATADAGVNASKSFLARRRAELMLELGKLAEAHPGRTAISAELAEIDTEIERVGKVALSAARSMLTKERAAELESNRSKLLAAAEEARKIETDLEQEVEKHREKVSWFARRYTEALTLKRAMERDRKRLDMVEDRVQFLTLEAAAPGFVRIASAARDPLLPIRGGRRMLFAISLLAGVALGAAVPIVIDRLDPRLHTPDELRSVLGFAPLGWLPRLEGDASQLLRIDRRRRLALALDAEMGKDSLRTIAVTPVSLEGDAIAVVREIEAGLRNIGRVGCAWSIDAAGRLRRLGSGNEEAVDDDEGPTVQSPADLHRLLREGSDAEAWSILATPPLAGSSAAELVVRSADASLLLVQASSSTCGQVADCAAAMERLDPRAAGAVMLDVRVEGAAARLHPGFGEAAIGAPSGAAWRWLWAA